MGHLHTTYSSAADRTPLHLVVHSNSEVFLHMRADSLVHSRGLCRCGAVRMDDGAVSRYVGSERSAGWVMRPKKEVGLRRIACRNAHEKSDFSVAEGGMLWYGNDG